jgi:hypothetical protein
MAALQVGPSVAINRDAVSSRVQGIGDSRLMGPVSGLLWMTAGVAAVVCQLVPGVEGSGSGITRT